MPFRASYGAAKFSFSVLFVCFLLFPAARSHRECPEILEIALGTTIVRWHGVRDSFGTVPAGTSALQFHYNFHPPWLEVEDLVAVNITLHSPHVHTTFLNTLGRVTWLHVPTFFWTHHKLRVYFTFDFTLLLEKEAAHFHKDCRSSTSFWYPLWSAPWFSFPFVYV